MILKLFWVKKLHNAALNDQEKQAALTVAPAWLTVPPSDMPCLLKRAGERLISNVKLLIQSYYWLLWSYLFWGKTYADKLAAEIVLNNEQRRKSN